MMNIKYFYNLFKGQSIKVETLTEIVSHLNFTTTEKYRPGIVLSKKKATPPPINMLVLNKTRNISSMIGSPEKDKYDIVTKRLLQLLVWDYTSKIL